VAMSRVREMRILVQTQVRDCRCFFLPVYLCGYVVMCLCLFYQTHLYDYVLVFFEEGGLWVGCGLYVWDNVVFVYA
jgi:hypothetical protein